MTYRTLCAMLADAGIDAPAYDAARLIAHFCGVAEASVPLMPDRDYDLPALADAARQRACRVPLQYLIGEWEFYRQCYEVSPDCLIPRPDTEILVEEALSLLPHGARFIDLCTGCGCVAISVLAERPDLEAVAVDCFERTLALAARNAAKNKVSERLCLQLADVLCPDFLPAGAPFDAILSNPPYIRADILPTLSPEVQAEPIAALDGGEDGLLFYRAILARADLLLKPGGLILFEIGYDQAEQLRALAREHGFSNFRLRRDYGGADRVVCLSKGAE